MRGGEVKGEERRGQKTVILNRRVNWRNKAVEFLGNFNDLKRTAIKHKMGLFNMVMGIYVCLFQPHYLLKCLRVYSHRQELGFFQASKTERKRDKSVLINYNPYIEIKNCFWNWSSLRKYIKQIFPRLHVPLL